MHLGHVVAGVELEFQVEVKGSSVVELEVVWFQMEDNSGVELEAAGGLG